MEQRVELPVPFVRQKLGWDCGLACAAMVLRSFDLPTDRLYSSDHEWMNCKDSVWTIDLARLMEMKGIEHKYLTITKGVNDYEKEPFYKGSYRDNCDRVNALFQNAATDGVQLEIRSVTMDELVNHLKAGNMLICLVDANKLCCAACRSVCASCISCLPLFRRYQGHYVVVCGFDMKTKEIFYKNPDANHELCRDTMTAFDDSRKSFGTDEDTLFIYRTGTAS